MRVGVVSDTHGLLRPDALDFLRGCEHIVHAGDICDERTLAEIGQLAPVTVVRGNNDNGAWAEKIPYRQRVCLGGVEIFVVHDLTHLDIEPAAAGVRVVISGHTHAPHCREEGGVLYLNPGSAGPRRFRLPIAIGDMTIEAGTVSARTVTLG